LTLTLSSATDQGIHVRSDCADENSELGCADDFLGGSQETLSLAAQAGQPLAIFVDAFEPGEEGPFTLTLSLENAVCGDGLIAAAEECDDANAVAGDGCDAGCQIEDGFVCAGEPSVCVEPAGGCDSPLPANLGDNSGDTSLGLDLFDGSCQLGGAPEQMFSFSPGSAGILTLSLNSVADLGVYVRSDCADPGSELGCVDNLFGGAVETLVVEITDPSQVMAIAVDGFAAGEEGPFTLNLAFEEVICGDGILSGGEQCDDGNTTDGDDCSSLCLLENAFSEIEPNNTAGTANDFAAIAVNDRVTAQINPSGDLDFFVVTVPPGQVADLRVESLNGPLGTTCASFLVDTEFDVFDAAGTLLANDDDGAVGFCSLINLGGLPEGDYFIRVKSSDFDPTGTFDYTLNIVLTSVECGDGAVAVAEGCDDGNLTDGDGCDALCEIEPGFVCAGAPSVCEFACGNGALDIAEGCDDGNLTDGDGCGALCQIEDGFDCSGAPSICVDLGPACAAALPAVLGDNTGDTSSATDIFDGSCQLGGAPEQLFSFTPGGNNPGLLTLSLNSVADLGVYVRSDCADPGSELGCVDNLFGGAVETLVVEITDPNQPLTIFVDGFAAGEEGPFTLNLAFEEVICGDATVVVPEGCDDGNLTDGDGCDALCQIEDGFVCAGEPSVCEIACGNGALDLAEGCDDGNLTDGDGCDALCQIEDGFVCAGEPSVCASLVGACNAATPIIPGVNAGDTTGGVNLFEASCQLGGAPEQLFSFTPGGADPGALTIQLTSDNDLGVYVRSDCADPTSELGCIDNLFGAGAVETLVVDIIDPSQPLTIFVDGFANGIEGPFTLVVAFGPAVCGNNLVEPGEACDEGANNGLPGSVCALDCTLAPEAECSNFTDEDDDGLFDCEDSDCLSAGQCTPGATATGAPCTEATDCQANNNDPFCIKDADLGFPDGYCSEFCDLANDDCAGDSLCIDVGLPSGNGLCFDGCNIDNDCRAGYICDDGDFDGVPESCLPL
jgi:cysteine-rich repeat protein